MKRTIKNPKISRGGVSDKKLKRFKNAVFRLLPDKALIDIRYYRTFHRHINWKNPTTYSEKIQWIKLHDRKPEYPMMVDKYRVKNYITKIIGKQYVIPTLGVWDRFEDINFELLPDKFVLKCNHDSGSVVICRKKAEFDKVCAEEKITKALESNFYWMHREWAYKNVKPCIIAEEYLEDLSSDEPRDYKVFCFNGKARFFYVSEGLENHATARISFVTLDWKPAPYARRDYKQFEVLPPKPENLEEMINLAEKLSADMLFCRVDFYDVNGRIYFGELTLYPNGGFIPFENEEQDIAMGKLLKLPL